MKILRTYISFITLLIPLFSFGQFPYQESFKNDSATGFIYGGSPTAAMLTSGKAVKYSNSTGLITDAPGAGYLRLTNNDKNQSAYAYNNTPFPAQNGLKISFEYFIYGVSTGVGAGFFLFDGSVPFSIGAFGSSLGYAQSNLGGTTAGMAGGYLGFGLDTYGVFGRWNEGKQGGYTATKGQSLSIRGAGNGSAFVATNYPFLTGVQTSTWNSATNPNPNFGISGGAGVRAASCTDPTYRKIFIELKPKNVTGGKSYDITVKMIVGGAVPVTYTLIDNYTGFNTITPENLKIAFTACSGNSANYHEIRNLSIKPYYTETGEPTPFEYNPSCGNDPDPVSTTPVDPTTTLARIPIDPKRWFQLNSTTRGLDALFDSVTNVAVNTGWSWVLPKYDAYYPVKEGEQISLSHVRFYDWQGTSQDSLVLSVITQHGQRVPVGYFTGSRYMEWVGPQPNSTDTGLNKYKLDSVYNNIKYLVLTIKSVFPTEMELFGTYTAPPAPTAATKKLVRLKEMLGVNAFEWDFLGGGTTHPTKINPDKISAMKSFAGIRHYMDWEKLELTEGQYTFSPVHSGGWDYDAMYLRCKTEGIEVLACLKTIPSWMVSTYPTNQRDVENTPLKYGMDFSDPQSYIEQAKVGFQYAARYGSNPNVDLSLLSVNSNIRWTGDPVNVVKRGLDLVKYIECDNERNKWWKGRKGYQTAYEYAANLSAFYDGHKNTMGSGVGVKNADPNMMVVMGGLASQSTEYVRGMIDWCKRYRGLKPDGKVDICWDIINYHEYSNDVQSAQGETSTRGAAPEVTDLAANAGEFIQMSHEYADDMEVWITEAGFDINQGSTLKAIPIGSKSPAITQADWTLRSALHYARNGIKRVFFFKTYDVDSLSPTKFSSMGLLNKNKTRRPAADFMMQAKNLIGDYYYSQTLNSDPVVDRYEFNGKAAYVLVVPDETGRTASYNLNLGLADSARIYIPQAGSTEMSVTKVATADGMLALTVTETPSFVIPFADGSEENSSARLSYEAFSAPETTSSPGISMEVFPNPATDFIEVSSVGESPEPLEVRIYDSSGKLFRKRISPVSESNIKQKISMADAPFGIYLVKIKHGTNSSVKKVMKTF